MNDVAAMAMLGVLFVSGAFVAILYRIALDVLNPPDPDLLHWDPDEENDTDN